jgi:hypothetical protein
VRVVKQVEAPPKDHEVVKFVATVVLSTVLEAGLQTAASQVVTGGLAAISKRPDTWLEIICLLGWKVAKLGLYWFADFDGMLRDPTQHMCTTHTPI